MAAILNSSFFVDARTSTDDFSFGDLSKVKTSTLLEADGVYKVQKSLSTGSYTSLNQGGEFDMGWLISDKAVTVVWIGATAADNSAVYLPAGEPFIFPTGTTSAYSASPSTRCTNADTDIGSGVVYVRNNSGSTAVLRFFSASIDVES